MKESVFNFENSSPTGPPISRRNLLALGAAAGVALALPALPARADVAYSDAMSMRFLQEVAQLESDFFTRAATSRGAEALSERESNTLAWIALQDAELVRWFKAAMSTTNLGAASTFFTPNTSSSRPTPVYHFGADSLKTRASLYEAAIAIKQTAVGAFHGAVGHADTPDMIQAFAALGGVQGRHLAVLLELSGARPFVATEKALSKNQVTDQLMAYGFKGEAAA